MDWLKRIFIDPATLVVLISSGIIGFIVGIANGVVQKRYDGWGGFFSALGTAVVIAIIVGFALHDYIQSESVRIAIIAVCSLISEDIREGLKTLGVGLRTDPLGTVVRVFDALRARSTNTPSTPKE